MCGVGLRPPHVPLFALACSTGTILPCGAQRHDKTYARSFGSEKGTEQPDARRKLLPLKVYCTKEERALIEGQAETAGMSVSEYLRNVGKGTPVKSRVDVQAIKALAKVNADLGRAGGLLKMLLKNEERLIGYSGEQLRQMTNNTVGEINRIQSSLALISKRILRD